MLPPMIAPEHEITFRGVADCFSVFNRLVAGVWSRGAPIRFAEHGSGALRTGHSTSWPLRAGIMGVP
jgi:hypothetical protein